MLKLLEHGALVEARTRHGWRAIHVACAFAKPLVVRMLLAQDKCRVDWATDGERNCAVHLAAGSDGDVDDVDEVLEMLKAAGADLNAQNFMGRTPLHVAAEKNKRRAVVKLLSLGADLSLEDAQRWSPRQLAEFMGHKGCEDAMIDSLCSETQLREDLPAPKWQSHYWSDATLDRDAAQLRALRDDFKRETYRLNEGYLSDYLHDVDFRAHLRKHGPGQTPFDYDHHRATHRGVDMHVERAKERRERAVRLKEQQVKLKFAAAAFADLHYAGASLGFDAQTENSYKKNLLHSLGGTDRSSAAPAVSQLLLRPRRRGFKLTRVGHDGWKQ